MTYSHFNCLLRFQIKIDEDRVEESFVRAERDIEKEGAMSIRREMFTTFGCVKCGKRKERNVDYYRATFNT